jgi:signal transduction histidine kinase
VSRGPSLTLRLTARLLLVEFLGVFIALTISYALEVAGLVGNRDVLISDYAYNRINRFVVDSLTRDDDGTLRITPTAELRARQERIPSLQFAIFEELDRPALPGSSPELAALLSNDGRLRTRGQRFTIASRPGFTGRGYVSVFDTPHGRLISAASGYDIEWADLLYLLADDIGFTSAFVLVVAIASTAVTWYGVKTALSPLRRIAADARRIDMSSLGQGIDPTGAPSEIRPLIDAINEALARLDGSVARMRRYTANAAHELRTPLAVLRARLQNKEEPSFKLDLEQDASQLQAIVEQMLIAARLGEGQVSQDEEVDLVETAWSVVAGRAPLAIKCGRQIEFETIGATCPVRGNARAIASVIGNLLDNALRAEPEGGAVLTRVDGAMIEVVDHGEGIAPSDRELIFEPFWRKSEATPGTGLGLAVAKEVAEKMQGRIAVADTPGGGATFRLWLRRAQAVDGA